jgi:hypothetical protein
VRCPRCGNENPWSNRFCGMCGATLLVASAPATSIPASARPAEPSRPPVNRDAGTAAIPSAPPRPPEPVPSREPEPSHEISEPSEVFISGPSFLGLNQPGPARGGNSGRDLRSETSSRSLDYLLEDEETEEKRGWGKFVLLVIALALALGFGYLRWRNQGLDWLTSGIKKPAESSQNDSSLPEANSNAQNSASPSSAGNTPATNPAGTSPSNNIAATTPSGAQLPLAAGPSAATAPANAANTNSETVVPVDTDTSPKTSSDAGANAAADKTSSTNPAAASNSVKDSPDSDASPATPAPNLKNTLRGKASNDDEWAKISDDDEATPVAKPTPTLAKPRPVTPVNTVAEAEKYIYGRGAAQDCDRGLKMLRPAANQGDARAMISLGALYSAGLCAPRDLPTAYRWFAVALRKEPDNNSVQSDLQKLWSEMTQPERQLAIRLSQ